jgi:hypothetical protein
VTKQPPRFPIAYTLGWDILLDRIQGR